MDEVLHHTTHIPQWKRDEIEDIKAKIQQYSVVGLIGIHGMPSKQFQQMRSTLKDSAVIKICKNNLIRRAIDESPDKIKAMEKHIVEETGLVFSNENSFKLFKLFLSSKTPAPIKAGMEASKDITVEKGPTAFPPGPIVGELQAAGIPAAIEGGKVVIRETKVVAKQGEIVSRKLAGILGRLEIFPVELGLELRATFEDDMVFDASTLVIDEILYSRNFTTAAIQAFNLAINVAYPIKLTIPTLIALAVSESKNLAVNAVIFTPCVMGTLLSRARGQMLALSSALSKEALDEELNTLLGAQVEETIPVAQVEVEETKEEQEKEPVTKTEKEEKAAEGLSALFG
jgi:large subunit ribosomal protein L10